MRFERTNVAKEGLVSLRNCFLEGSAEEERGARKVRRRAILTSIIVQILVLAALVLYPMLGRGERLPLTFVTPTVPYSHHVGNSGKTDTHPRGSKPTQACHFCQPPRIPKGIVTIDHNKPVGDNTGQDGPTIPGTQVGDNIPGTPFAPGSESVPVKPQQEVKTHENKRISIGHIEPAMLTRRVEPVYPALPRQLHREGRVELRAIIATDGTIQSLEVVSGDPLFYASALAAVREWRYKATVLDGQPVEVETQISVIYRLNQ